jgi:hypothetical protein
MCGVGSLTHFNPFPMGLPVPQAALGRHAVPHRMACAGRKDGLDYER